MSGVLVIPNQFAAAVTATAGAIDVNFNSVTAYINDPTNRNNYAADTGGTNTVVLSFSPPVAGAYSAGLDLTWKWAFTPTGACVVNANALGNASLVNQDGSNLVSGQGAQGGIGHAAYDGTRYIYLTPPSPASAAAVSAAVTLAPYVSPGRMQNHPGVAKAYAAFNGTNTGTISAISSYNVTSIVRTGTGSYAVSITTPFTSLPAVSGVTGTNDRVLAINTGVASNSATIQLTVFVGATGVAEDSTYVSFICFGAQ